MNRARSSLIGSLLAVALGCGDRPIDRRVQDCSPSEEERVATHPRAAELDSLLADAVRAGLPGALMAVRQGETHWYGAAGAPDLAEPERPFRTCHIIPIKSITKSFVAVRVLQLVQEGALDLDAPLASLLPRATLASLPNVSRISVRHLLNHRSGLRHYPEVLGYVTDFLNRSQRSHSRAEALDAVRGLDAYFPPGEGFHYSNTNALLLQAMLEQYTGRSLEAELRDAIFEPLGMRHSHLHQDQPLSDHVPMGYMDLYGNGDAHQIDTLDDVSSAAGGMESTLADLVRFSTALLAERTLLGPETYRELTRFEPVDEARWKYTQTGLGIFVWNTSLGPVLGHTGEDTGYKAYWHYAPRRELTWILLLNSNYGRFEQQASELRERVLALVATD